MTEIPEHLRKRAEEARKKAEAAKGGGGAPAADAGSGAGAEAASGGGGEAPPSEAASRIPAHLLERSRAAKARAGGEGADAGAESGGGGGTAVATAPAAAAAAAPVAPPLATGPGGHTQRLLTVVKSGSIQDVKAVPQDKVHVWPHLLSVEFVAALACTAFLLVFSTFVNAPLLELANANQTPNPSKAPWYFLGLQELLTMFHPMVAGVTIPGLGLIGLILAPYTDRNPSHKPEDRKFAISIFTIFLMSWTVLVMIGSFFRGPGQNFVFPWNAGLFFDL
ncbi:MAG TPA: menaquinol-cytochrome c reductase cytochrome b subunit [Acidimicrobiales bacterium]|nr:menaquinol-cytochrome c reductase cytochrome b subunit [Acidimicrobiales bacterium]